MNKIPAKYTLVRVNELLKRAVELPNRIFEDEDMPGSTLPEDEKKRLDEKYNQKRNNLLFEVQEISLETRGLIKNIYGKENEYFPWINKIDFTSESSGIVINTYNVAHNTYWQKGRQSLISLLSNIKSEEEERAKLEELMIDKTMPLRIGGFSTILIISLLAIWMMPAEMMANVFAPEKIFAARLGLSATLGCFAMIILSRENWKEFLLGGVIAGGFTLIGLVKPDEVKTSQSKSLKVDSTAAKQNTQQDSSVLMPKKTTQ